MMETYRTLRELANLHTGTNTNEEIALMYQQSEDPVLLAYMYCNNLGGWESMTKDFFSLSTSDIESFVLEEIHSAMLKYDPKRGASFFTIVGHFIKNRLRNEVTTLLYEKRKINLNADSYEGMLESPEIGFKHSGIVDDNINSIDLLETLSKDESLTENEYKYCEIIIKEIADPRHIKDSEIAARLNVTSAAVHYMKKSLKRKLQAILLSASETLS